jgi:hypothetical protein
MDNHFRSLLLFSARLVVAYPATWLADVLDTARCRQQSPFDWLARAPVRRWVACLAPRNGAELTLFGLAVTVSAFILALSVLPE